MAQSILGYRGRQNSAMSSMGKQQNCNLFQVSDVAYGPLAGGYFDFMFDFYERNACTVYYK